MDEEHSFADLNFEPGSFSLVEIVQKFPLPVVVCCDAANSSVPVDRTRFNLDLRQPLLLYRNRNIRKVSARSVHIDPASRAFHDVGEPLLIPEDYKGYFSLLKKNYNNGPVDDFVPHYQEILEVAETNTETFLIGGERRVQALQIVRRENGSIIHQQRTLFPGDVLRKGKIYIGEKRRKSKLFRKTKVVTEKYLLCTDDADREILLPFDQKGLFYTLSTNTGDANRPVMQMSDVVNKKCFPCIVRLVYGRIPNTPCSFTGTLRLERADLEQSVIAATLVNARNILLEIPTSCDLRFNVAICNDDLYRNSSYHQALELCNEKGSIYMRNIKVCFTIDSDTHNKGLSNLPMEQSDGTEAVQRRRNLSKQLSVGTDASGDTSVGSQSRADRTSDYVEMVSVKSDSVTEDSMDEDLNGFSLFSKEISCNEENPPPCTCTPQFTNPSYMENSGGSQPKNNKETSPVLQIFLENKLVSVEIDESSTDPSGEVEESNQSANLDPVPSPCVGCAGSYDSGIQMELESHGGRRPSTHVFSEAGRYAEDDVTYDVPRFPNRRVSAPAGCSLASSSAENNIPSAKEAFDRRPSTSPRRPPPPLPTADFMTIEFPIEEYDSEEDTNEPLYQNIEGSRSNLEDIQGDNLRHTPLGSRCSSTRDSGHLSDECLPNRSSNNHDKNQLSSNVFQSIQIGDIPDLPRSRPNSSGSNIDDYQNSPKKIPPLPAVKGLLAKKRCDSPSLSVDSTKQSEQSGSNEENNNESKSSDVERVETTDKEEINTEDFTQVLTLNETEREDMVTKEPQTQDNTSESQDKLCLNSSETDSMERNNSNLSVQNMDVSDDNLEELEGKERQITRDDEKHVSRRLRSKIGAEKKKSRQSKDVSKMSAEELATEFRRVGIKPTTIELVLSLNLNGLALLEKYQTHCSIGDFLPSAGLIDQQKISLFIQGCKY